MLIIKKPTVNRDTVWEVGKLQRICLYDNYIIGISSHMLANTAIGFNNTSDFFILVVRAHSMVICLFFS